MAAITARSLPITAADQGCSNLCLARISRKNRGSTGTAMVYAMRPAGATGTRKPTWSLTRFPTDGLPVDHTRARDPGSRTGGSVRRAGTAGS